MKINCDDDDNFFSIYYLQTLYTFIFFAIPIRISFSRNCLTRIFVLNTKKSLALSLSIYIKKTKCSQEKLHNSLYI